MESLKGHRLIGYVEDLLFSERLNTPKSLWPQWSSQVAVYSPIGQVEAVKAGLGIGMLHRFLLSESDELVHLLPEQDMYREFFLVYHQSTEKIPRIRAAIGFLQSLTVE